MYVMYTYFYCSSLYRFSSLFIGSSHIIVARHFFCHHLPIPPFSVYLFKVVLQSNGQGCLYYRGSVAILSKLRRKRKKDVHVCGMCSIYNKRLVFENMFNHLDNFQLFFYNRTKDVLTVQDIRFVNCTLVEKSYYIAHFQIRSLVSNQTFLFALFIHIVFAIQCGSTYTG